MLYQLSYSRNCLKTAVQHLVACATVREPNYKSSHSNCKGFFVTVQPFAQKLAELPILATERRQPLAGDSDFEDVAAVELQFGDGLADVVQRLMGTALGELIQQLRLPATY